MTNLFFISARTQNLTRYCFLVLLLAAVSLSSFARAATLSASVDRDTISLQETLNLTLRYSEQSSQSPDFSKLQNDFDILNTQQSNQMSVINGSMESYTDWRVALAPKRVGTLTIPAFNVEGNTSDPIAITVQSQSEAPKNSDSKVFTDIEVDHDSAYVQQQILLTIRLYSAVNLNGAELQPLDLPDAVVVDLGDTNYQTTIHGRPHIVVEKTYSIFPQHSGSITIPSLTYNVSTSSGQRDLWGNRNGNLLRLRTEEKTIAVNSIPPQFNGQPWIPAKNVSLSEHWSSGTDHLKVGEPVTRTITITANGLTAGQIAPLTENPLDGLTFYPDQAQTDDQNTKKGVIGSRIETTAIIPNHSGKFTLPAVSVNWWNTATNQMETATLPPKVIHVEDTAASIAKSANSQPAAAETAAEATPVTTALNQQPAPQTIAPAPGWMHFAIGAIALLCLVFAALYFNTRRKLAALSAPHSGAQEKTHLAESHAWTALKRASADKDYLAMRNAALQWAQAHWQDAQIHSLSDIADKAGDDALREQLRELDAALYSGGDKHTWDSGILLQRINDQRRRKRGQKTNSDGLAPLYKK